MELLQKEKAMEEVSASSKLETAESHEITCMQNDNCFFSNSDFVS